MRLTDLTIQKLAPPERGQKMYADEILVGFGVRVSQGGSKTFILIVGKDRQRITIGRYGPTGLSLADARKKAAAILRDRVLGIEHKAAPTFKYGPHRIP